MAKKYPPITTSEILRLREHCLEREAKGNKPGGPFTDNVDLRRGIIFYHHIAGEYYLYRDWRETFNKKYPKHAVPEESTLKPRKVYPGRRVLNDMVHRLYWYDRSICWITRRESKWLLIRTTDESGYSQTYSHAADAMRYVSEEYNNSIEAYEALSALHELFVHSCPFCGCDWRETKRYKDDGDRWHCGCCHATPENSQITGAEPAIRQPIDATMEPMIGGEGSKNKIV